MYHLRPENRASQASTKSGQVQFALFSGIEDDLRKTTVEHLAPEGTPLLLLGQDLLERSTSRLLKEEQESTASVELHRLVPYLDFGDLFQLLNRHRAKLPQTVANEIRSRTSELEALVPIRNRVAHYRPLQFDDLAVVRDFCDDLSRSAAGIWPHVLDTCARLEKDPSWVLRLEVPNESLGSSKVKHNLPVPEFDETGFIGRESATESILTAINGPFPVISILGEGGLGKTALALKVAYDVISEDSGRFDAVVYTSSRTSTLGPQEIRRVEGAIESSLGMFSSIASELGANDLTDPAAEILEYLRTFKILLILDNLETVLDQNIKAFLAQMPSGSKALITSRIGIGQLEFPIRISSLSTSESVQLLRAVARVRGVASIATLSQKRLAELCERMRNNPGHLKWFVSAVQAGARPEDILANDRIFLDYCLSNVYNFLGDQSRRVLGALLSTGGQFTLAELSFLSGLDDLEIQQAVQQLLATSMLLPCGASSLAEETHYELPQLARAYLAKHLKVDAESVREFIRAKRQIISAAEAAKSGYHIVRGERYPLAVRSRSEVLVAKYLQDAIEAKNRSDFIEAQSILDRARNLSPRYFEVHRVAASIAIAQGDLSLARFSYEAAIDAEPRSASTRMMFGGFLMRELQDSEAALEQFRQAATLDSTFVEARYETARALLWLQQFPEVREILDKERNATSVSEKNRRVLTDLEIQYHYRLADLSTLKGEPWRAVQELSAIRSIIDSALPGFVDARVRERLRKCRRTADSCAYLLYGSELHSTVISFLSWLAQIAPVSKPLAVGETHQGIVARLPPTGNFGFIRVDDATDVFFHKQGLLNQDNWSTIAIGDRVSFSVGINENGSCGINVSVVEHADHSLSASGLRRRGTILRIASNGNFGFLRDEKGPEVFFHLSEVTESDRTRPIEAGTSISYTLEQDGTNRTRATKIVIEQE